MREGGREVKIWTVNEFINGSAGRTYPARSAHRKLCRECALAAPRFLVAQRGAPTAEKQAAARCFFSYNVLDTSKVPLEALPEALFNYSTLLLLYYYLKKKI